MEEMVVKCNLIDRVMFVNERIQLVLFDTESCLTAIRSFVKQHETLKTPYITYNPSPGFYIDRTRGALLYGQVNQNDLMKGCRFVSYDEENRQATIAFDEPGALNVVKLMMPAKEPILLIRTLGKVRPRVVDEVTKETKLYYLLDRFISLDLVMVEHKEDDTNGNGKDDSERDPGNADGTGEDSGDVSESEGGLELSEKH